MSWLRGLPFREVELVDLWPLMLVPRTVCGPAGGGTSRRVPYGSVVARRRAYVASPGARVRLGAFLLLPLACNAFAVLLRPHSEHPFVQWLALAYFTGLCALLMVGFCVAAEHTARLSTVVGASACDETRARLLALLRRAGSPVPQLVVAAVSAAGAAFALDAVRTDIAPSLPVSAASFVGVSQVAAVGGVAAYWIYVAVCMLRIITLAPRFPVRLVDPARTPTIERLAHSYTSISVWTTAIFVCGEVPVAWMLSAGPVHKAVTVVNVTATTSALAFASLMLVAPHALLSRLIRRRKSEILDAILESPSWLGVISLDGSESARGFIALADSGEDGRLAAYRTVTASADASYRPLGLVTYGAAISAIALPYLARLLYGAFSAH